MNKKKGPEGETGSSNKHNFGNPKAHQRWDQINNDELIEASEQVKRRAKILGEKVLEVAADDTSDVFGSEDKKMSIPQIREKARVYLNRFRSRKQIRDLQTSKEVLVTKLGMIIYEKYRIEKNKWDTLFEIEEVRDVIRQITSVEEQMIALGQKLDQKENR